MIENRIMELGYTLPTPSKGTPNFASVLIYENLAFVSGTLPYVNGYLPIKGQLGGKVSLEEGKELARICVINILANLKGELGSLNRVQQILKINGYISSEKEFTQQGIVLNAASDLILDIFNENGKHARSAIGVPVMPKNTPIEIEMTVAIKP